MSEPHAHPRLVAFWEACAPAGWTVVAAERSAGAWRVRLRDASGAEHALAWDAADPRRPALVRGQRLAFAYQPSAASAPVAEYRATFARAIDREAELAALCEAEPEAAPDASAAPEPPPLFVRESKLVLELARARLGAPSIEAAADRWLRAAVPDGDARTLMLYFEAPCHQACEFCEVPQHRARPLYRGVERLVQLNQASPLDLVASGAFAAILRAAAARRPALPVTITGHDWLQHPRLDALLHALEAAPDVPLGLYGPSTRLADEALAERVAKLPGLRWIGLTLLSSDPAVHDAIAGAPGSGRAVLVAIEHLARRAVPLRVTFVLTRRALPTLGATLAWAADHGVRLTLQAFIPDRDLQGSAAVHAPADATLSALSALDARARDAIAAIVAVPRCAAPRELVDRLEPALATDTREPPAYPPPCAPCPERRICPGVPASYVDALGARGLSPPRRSPPPRS